MNEIIRLDGVSHWYDNSVSRQFTLQDLNFGVAEGEIVCILGPSGCGKSTLLNLLAGFITPKSGQIVMPENNQDAARSFSDISVVMQHAHLFPWLTVRKNVEFGLRMRGDDKTQRAARVDELLNLIGLPGTENKYPAHLSGGMQQRVAIARALAPNPSILLMDEPFGALDAQMRRHMQSETVRIWKATGKTIIFVTHDISESVLLANRIIILTNSPGQVRSVMPIDIPYPRERNRDVYDKVFELEQLLL